MVKIDNIPEYFAVLFDYREIDVNITFVHCDNYLQTASVAQANELIYNNKSKSFHSRPSTVSIYFEKNIFQGPLNI